MQWHIKTRYLKFIYIHIFSNYCLEYVIYIHDIFIFDYFFRAFIDFYRVIYSTSIKYFKKLIISRLLIFHAIFPLQNVKYFLVRIEYLTSIVESPVSGSHPPIELLESLVLYSLLTLTYAKKTLKDNFGKYIIPIFPV